MFGTIDNSDTVHDTFQGFQSFLVFDTKFSIGLNERWTMSLGVDNLFDRKYFIYHPFPQRSVLLEVHYAQ